MPGLSAGVDDHPCLHALLYAAMAALACYGAASGRLPLLLQSAQQRRSFDVCMLSAKLYRDITDFLVPVQTVLWAVSGCHCETDMSFAGARRQHCHAHCGDPATVS